MSKTETTFVLILLVDLSHSLETKSFVSSFNPFSYLVDLQQLVDLSFLVQPLHLFMILDWKFHQT
jgi:hypothetical protein